MNRKIFINKYIRCTVICMLMMAMIFMLASCNKGDNSSNPHEIGNTGIYFYTETTKVDLEYGSETLGFPLFFVSDKPVDEDEIKLVRLEGENVDYFENTVLTRRQIDDVTDVKIDGKYLYPYNIDCNIDIDYFTPMADIEPPIIWEIRVDAAIVNIRGKEYTVKFEYPVQYHYNDKNYDDIDGNHMYGPLVVMTFGLTQQYSVNIYNYENDIVLTDFYFSDFITAQDKQVYYKGRYLGNLSGTEKYNISQRTAGSEAGAAGGATIYFTPCHSELNHSTEFDYILCTAIVEYQIDGDDTIYRMRFPFNAQGIGNRETAEKFLDYVAALE